MIMGSSLKMKLISFKQLGLFFLLLSLQLHLLALPQNSMVAAGDGLVDVKRVLLIDPTRIELIHDQQTRHFFGINNLNHEKNIGREPIVPKKLSLSVKLEDKQIKAVGRRGGGGAAAHGGGGEHGIAGGAAGENGGSRSPNGQSGAVIPVYVAGAMNHNRYHHHGSGSGTLNCIGPSCLVLILFTSFFVYYST